MASQLGNPLHAEFSEATFDLSLNLLSCVFLGLFLFGLIKTLYLFMRFASFLHLHFVHSSKLHQYRRPGAWALVTGASSGIGEAFARGLARNEFNVVLHGRNEEKLKILAAKLEGEFKTVSFKYVIADAATSHGMKQAIERMANEMAQLPGPLTVLVNNAGGMHGIYGDRSPMLPVQNATASEVDGVLNLNLRFTAQVTRALLPILAKADTDVKLEETEMTKAPPFLILNLSSVTGLWGFPLLGVYSGTKAFILMWSRGLSQELAMQPRLSAGECMCLETGEVTGGGGDSSKASFITPNTDTFVKATLDKVGCGRMSLRPYIGHDLVISLSVDLLPEWALKLMFKMTMAEQARFWRNREMELAKKQ